MVSHNTNALSSHISDLESYAGKRKRKPGSGRFEVDQVSSSSNSPTKTARHHHHLQHNHMSSIPSSLSRSSSRELATKRSLLLEALTYTSNNDAYPSYDDEDNERPLATEASFGG